MCPTGDKAGPRSSLRLLEEQCVCFLELLSSPHKTHQMEASIKDINQTMVEVIPLTGFVTVSPLSISNEVDSNLIETLTMLANWQLQELYCYEAGLI